jgi:agmatinase
MKIIKVPGVNGLGKTNGTELAPEKISPEGETLELNNSNIEEQEKKIYEATKNLDEKTIFIGGDHSISYPIVKALSEKNKELKLIILDAHPDLMPPMENPTHEEWLAAIVGRYIAPENIMLIGARKIDPAEKGYPIQTIAIEELSTAKEKIKEFAKDSQVYLSIDIDFFDENVAPATGYPEKNGAQKEEGLKLIKDITQNMKIISSDIVEINPTKPEAEKTIQLAKEILEILKV